MEEPQVIKEEKSRTWPFLIAFFVIIVLLAYLVYRMDVKPVDIGNDTSSLIDESGKVVDDKAIAIDPSQAEKVVKNVTASSQVTINILPAEA
jgi:hypothetical protein